MYLGLAPLPLVFWGLLGAALASSADKHKWGEHWSSTWRWDDQAMTVRPIWTVSQSVYILFLGDSSGDSTDNNWKILWKVEMKQVFQCCSRPHKGLSVADQIYIRTTKGEVLAKESCQNICSVKKQACYGTCYCAFAGSHTTKANTPDARGVASVLGTAMHHESL